MSFCIGMTGAGAISNQDRSHSSPPLYTSCIANECLSNMASIKSLMALQSAHLHSQPDHSKPIQAHSQLSCKLQLSGHCSHLLAMRTPPLQEMPHFFRALISCIAEAGLGVWTLQILSAHSCAALATPGVAYFAHLPVTPHVSQNSYMALALALPTFGLLLCSHPRT